MNPELLKILQSLSAAGHSLGHPLDEVSKEATNFGQGQGNWLMQLAHAATQPHPMLNADDATRSSAILDAAKLSAMFGGHLGTADASALHAPNPELAAVAQKYIKDNGITSTPLGKISGVNVGRGKEMADVYDNLKSDPSDPAVQQAYTQFGKEVKQQHQALLDAGYNFDFSPHDPYPNSAAMLKDLRDNKTIKVFKTGEGQEHPLMSNDENDMFRAIHDSFGHGISGNQFGPSGEDNAFRDHSAMFSPLAQRVMATETRGQNSWTNFGPRSDAPVTERPFAEQKAALWPEPYMGEYNKMPMNAPATALTFGGHTVKFPEAADADAQESMIKRAEQYYGPRDSQNPSDRSPDWLTKHLLAGPR